MLDFVVVVAKILFFSCNYNKTNLIYCQLHFKNFCMFVMSGDNRSVKLLRQGIRSSTVRRQRISSLIPASLILMR